MSTLEKIIAAAKECRTESKHMKQVAKLVKNPSQISVWLNKAEGNAEKLESLELLKKEAENLKIIEELPAFKRTPEQAKALSKYMNRSLIKNFKTAFTDIMGEKYAERLKQSMTKKSWLHPSTLPKVALVATLGIFAVTMLALTADKWSPLLKNLFKKNDDLEPEVQEIPDSLKVLKRPDSKQVPADSDKQKDTAKENKVNSPSVPAKAVDKKSQESKSSNVYTIEAGNTLWGISDKELKKQLGRNPNPAERRAYEIQIMENEENKRKYQWSNDSTHVNLPIGGSMVLPEFDKTKVRKSSVASPMSNDAAPKQETPKNEKSEVKVNTDKKAVSDKKSVKGEDKKAQKVVKQQKEDTVQTVNTQTENVQPVVEKEKPEVQKIEPPVKKQEESIEQTEQVEQKVQDEPEITNTDSNVQLIVPLSVDDWIQQNYENPVKQKYFEYDIDSALRNPEYFKEVNRALKDEETQRKQKEQEEKFYEWMSIEAMPKYSRYLDSIKNENRKLAEQQK